MSRMLYILTILCLLSRPAASAPSCGAVVTELTPCLGYLQGQPPSGECCAGVKKLKEMAKAKGDQVAICNCFKDALSAFKYDPSILPLLPNKCGVVGLDLPPVDKNYDCSQLQLEWATVFDS